MQILVMTVCNINDSMLALLVMSYESVLHVLQAHNKTQLASHTRNYHVFLF